MDECAVYGVKFLDPDVESPENQSGHLYPASAEDDSCGVPQHHINIRTEEEPNVELSVNFKGDDTNTKKTSFWEFPDEIEG